MIKLKSYNQTLNQCATICYHFELYYPLMSELRQLLFWKIFFIARKLKKNI